MSERQKIALVGIGKIAVHQHVPALAASPDWQLAATVSRSGTVDGVEAFTDIATMLDSRPDIAMVSLALPPVPRFAYAQAALRAGRHVMLEKPPGATLAEIHALQVLADTQGVTLYATWHSRMAHAVAPAKAWLADKTITRAHITWREDVRKWHPGQDWVFEPGGMGVFDPGINALSILTEILPAPVHVTAAELEFPANRDTPIAARIAFSHAFACKAKSSAESERNSTTKIAPGSPSTKKRFKLWKKVLVSINEVKKKLSDFSLVIKFLKNRIFKILQFVDFKGLSEFLPHLFHDDCQRTSIFQQQDIKATCQ